MSIQQYTASVKEEISLAFNHAVELVKTQEAFLKNQVEWKERKKRNNISVQNQNNNYAPTVRVKEYPIKLTTRHIHTRKIAFNTYLKF